MFAISDVFYSFFVHFLSVPIVFCALFSAFALSGPPYLCELPDFLHRSSCPLLAMGKNADYDRFLQLKARDVIFLVSKASVYICCPAVLVACSYTASVESEILKTYAKWVQHLGLVIQLVW